ncbi:MAG: histidinol phosphatase [Candidatus Caenarcaniphilales bacterium]|nr:histidinol phosphatase [Candidatus Caenarcaniphilales bacterium]
MHTVSTVSDRPFEFCLDALKYYVISASLDAIAITNHNMFDLAQFKTIKDSVDAVVFPGIEIDLEGCHLLLIADDKELFDFSTRCNRITSAIPTNDSFITYEELVEIFPDLDKYILIPHYQKSPEISPETLRKFGLLITAGEVTSPKKFIYCLRDENSLVPVCFSDLRINKNLTNIPSRQTYLNIGELGLSGIKGCLRDKQKVFLSLKDGHNIFNVLNGNLRLSTGLNVVIGERSSGKSYTLDHIYDQSDEIRVKYIRQFSLLQREQDEDLRSFSESINRSQSKLTEDYLAEFKSVVDDVVDIDLYVNERAVEIYIESLKKHAHEIEKQDAFSRAKLFNESEFPGSDPSSIRELISSVNNLIVNSEYRSTIDNHISIGQLKSLIVELIAIHNFEEESLLKKRYLNDLIISIKDNLRLRSASQPIEDFDFYSFLMDKKKIEVFSHLVHQIKKDRETLRVDVQGYQRVARSVSFRGAQELKKISKKVISFAGAYNSYDHPYNYLCALKQIEGLEVVELYKYFVRLNYEILNSDGFPVSGGERSEYRLLREIKDAQRYDMLMLDEPESSFDNLFLLKKANALIKDISKTMPVVVVTHNSTIGASIKPDFIVYTKKHTGGSKVYYDIYTGYPSDRYLTGLNGDKIKNHEAIINSLEAGEDTYNERREGYEILKN